MTPTIAVVAAPTVGGSIKVFLGGATDITRDTPTPLLMWDYLRRQGKLPTTEPYTGMTGVFTHTGGGGGEQVTASVFLTPTNSADAIVDWVFLELRSSTNMTTVVATQSALVQRDGDVVGVDGVNPPQWPGIYNNQSYYIALRHRNHLGVMTQTPVILSPSMAALDFMSPTGTAAYGTDPEKLDTNINLRMLWAGDANQDHKIVAGGADNDLSTIRTKLTLDPNNPSGAISIKFEGYFVEDVNLDGHVVGAGGYNDISTLRANIGADPINVTQSVSIEKLEQLPR